MTYTYATMDVPAAFYDVVEKKLIEAGYEHAINDDGAIDMHGIALTKAPPTDVEIDCSLYVQDIHRIIEACELDVKTATASDVIAAIEELKANQKLPDHTLGKYKDVCPHGRPLNVQCPECK